MRVRKFNVVINCYCLWKIQISNQSSTDKEIWSNKSWAINCFHLKKCPGSQLSTNSWQFWVNEAGISCAGCQAEKGQMDGQWVGEAQGLGSSLWCDTSKGDGRRGRTRAGEGYQGVFPLMYQDLLFVWPLCWQRILWQLFLSDFSFSPSQRWWWSWIAQVSAGVPAFRYSLPFVSL